MGSFCAPKNPASSQLPKRTPHEEFSPCALLTLAAASLLAAIPASAQTDDSKPAPPQSIKSLDLSAIDKTADPCTDFYQYACGNWVKDNPIPSDQTTWARSFSILNERNRYLLWQELMQRGQLIPSRRCRSSTATIMPPA